MKKILFLACFETLLIGQILPTIPRNVFRISFGSENQYDFNNNYINNFSNQIDLPSNNFQLNLTYKFN